MGLGKTIQTIGFLLALAAYKEENEGERHKPGTLIFCSRYKLCF
jgi:SNF2 family DNA or RNA helicase